MINECIKGVKKISCVRTGGWGKHNISFFCGEFCEAKNEIRRRRKSEGGAGIPFPPTPFPSRPV